MKKFFIFLPIILVIAGAAALDTWVHHSFSYNGLPMVSCLDSTKPLAQKFDFTLKISINGKNYPLAPDIGHDPGNCLRSLYTQDPSGTVYVRSNYQDRYTLSQFFAVWHKEFNDRTFIGYPLGQSHEARVYLNQQPVTTAENTEPGPGQTVQIIYR